MSANCTSSNTDSVTTLAL